MVNTLVRDVECQKICKHGFIRLSTLFSTIEARTSPIRLKIKNDSYALFTLYRLRQ